MVFEELGGLCGIRGVKRVVLYFKFVSQTLGTLAASVDHLCNYPTC